MGPAQGDGAPSPHMRARSPDQKPSRCSDSPALSHNKTILCESIPAIRRAAESIRPMDYSISLEFRPTSGLRNLQTISASLTTLSQLV